MSPLDQQTASRRLDEYRKVVRIGLGVAAALVAALSLAGRVQNLAKLLQTGSVPLQTWLAFALFLATLGLGAAWYVSGEREIEILSQYAPYAPQRPALLLWVVITAATTLVLLLYFSDRILLYSAIYLPYSIVAAGTRLLARRELGRVHKLAAADSTIPEAFKLAVKRYYISRPHAIHGLAVVLLACAGFLAASRSHDTGAHGLRAALPHLLILASILLSESVVWMWRARFYSDADEVDARQNRSPRLSSPQKDPDRS